MNFGVIICNTCGKVVKTSIKRDLWRKKYCSVYCRRKALKQSGKLTTKGIIWTEEVKKKMSRSKVGMYEGKNNPNWKGGIQHGNYVYKSIGVNMRQPLHRYLMEKLLGRKLRDGEVIHHIDGDKYNNNLSNLFLCKNMAQHRVLHSQANEIVFELVKRGVVCFDFEKGVYKICHDK